MRWFDSVSESIKDHRFLVVLVVFFSVVMLIRLPSKPLRLPEAAHNTIGDIPIFEQADDGYVNQVEPKPKERSYAESKRRHWGSAFYITYSGGIISNNNIFF